MIRTFDKNYSRSLNSLFIAQAGVNRFIRVTEAINLANDLLQNPEFYYQVAAHPGFDRSDVSPEVIAGLLCETQVKISVGLYYAKDAHRNIDIYDDLLDPSMVHLNIWTINRSAASICNSIIHGCIHAVNAYNMHYEFSHSDGSPAANHNTAPYWIGALAQRIVAGDDTIILPLEHDPEPPVRTAKNASPAIADSIWLTF